MRAIANRTPMRTRSCIQAQFLAVPFSLRSELRHSVEEDEMPTHTASLFDMPHSAKISMRCVCTLGRHDVVTPLGREIYARKWSKQSREAPGFPTATLGV